MQEMGDNQSKQCTAGPQGHSVLASGNSRECFMHLHHCLAWHLSPRGATHFPLPLTAAPAAPWNHKWDSNPFPLTRKPPISQTALFGRALIALFVVVSPCQGLASVVCVCRLSCAGQPMPSSPADRTMGSSSAILADMPGVIANMGLASACCHPHG